jgi:hypothetical protein
MEAVIKHRDIGKSSTETKGDAMVRIQGKGKKYVFPHPRGCESGGSSTHINIPENVKVVMIFQSVIVYMGNRSTCG